jgi:hypothetical protein
MGQGNRQKDLDQLSRKEGSNMVKVSIFSLIYQSPEWADFVIDSVRKYTPMIALGEAEFFFVANDATPEVIDHLKNKNYPHYVLVNERQSEEFLFSKGYAKPEYLTRVYKGFNFGIEKSKGEIVVIINSDMSFSPDWLENLIRCLSLKNVVSSQLVERDHPTFGVFQGVYHGEFGCGPADFKENEFLEFVLRTKTTGIIPGKGYSPCAFYKTNAYRVGLYPEGNIAGKTYEEVKEYGDERFFRKLLELGIPHHTVLDSIVYHFKEGERTPTPSNNPSPRAIPQPNYYPLTALKISDGKICLNNQPDFVIAFHRFTRKTRKAIKKVKVRLGALKNKVIGKK